MTKTYGIAEAKAKFTSLIEMVTMGEAVSITKNGKPVARLVPEKPKQRQLGQCAGMLTLKGPLKDPGDTFSEFYK